MYETNNLFFHQGKNTYTNSSYSFDFYMFLVYKIE